jgi:predicted RecB family nuclease
MQADPLITDAIFEAFLHCKYKSYLRLKGIPGHITEFESHRRILATAYADAAQFKLLGCALGEDIPRSVLADRQTLMAGTRLILDAKLTMDDLQATIDAVVRNDAESPLGNFSYLPVQYWREAKIPRVAKLLLAFQSMVLGKIQGSLPSHGVIVHGPDFTEEKLKLRSLHDRATRLLEELRAQFDATAEGCPRLNQHCAICEFRSHCRAAATKADDLSLLSGMTESEIAAQNQKGIFTVNQLSYTFRHRKPSKRAKHPSNPHHFALQALSLRTKKVHIHGTPILPAGETEVYFDIEGLPGEGYYYLIGAAVVQGGQVCHHAFWAESKSEHTAIFAQFAELVAQLPNYKLFHFGRYDIEAIHQMASEADVPLKVQLERLATESTNVLTLVHSHIYFPTYSNALKEVAFFLGFQWTESQASGIGAIIWREHWELTHDPLLKEKLIQYNREDCSALKLVCDFVRRATAETRTPESAELGYPEIVNTQDIGKSGRKWVKFCTPSFVLEDLERASNCAHFDYQRERVFTRADKRLARRNKTKRRKATSSRPNKRVEMTCTSCTHCGSRNIRRMRKVLRRRVVDLKFSRTGVRKYIVEYLARRHCCNDCGKRLLPEGWFKRESIYGEDLGIWCVYQNIACKQPMGRVTETLKDLFLLDIRPEQTRKFKRRVICRYKDLYEELRQHILRSHVLHIDEGDVAIRKSPKGYVWVFATSNAVWYLYKDTRSGEFLKELLKGFSGVLISDFYNAYDGITCPQQKCLLHLLRDLNDDLKSNPYDEEFKQITRTFAGILRGIVDTIDRFGLAKRHLHKHKARAEAFVRFVCSQEFSSEVASHYQKRFNKYGQRMFTFLDYDNVPWNNACAEYSVKSFMRYKATSDGLFTQRSLQESLVMLSVIQSCKLNGVNVLKFLLSRRTDIGAIFGLPLRDHGPIIGSQPACAPGHGVQDSKP